MTHTPDSSSVIALVAAIREEANAQLARMLAERGVTDVLPAHGSVLQCLYRHGPMRMRDLGDAIGRKKNTVTGLVTTLEERGYCQREPDPQDARAQVVSLTSKGKEFKDIHDIISAELLGKVWQGVGEWEKTTTMKTLAVIVSNLKQ